MGTINDEKVLEELITFIEATEETCNQRLTELTANWHLKSAT
jgi:hypothetical protein